MNVSLPWIYLAVAGAFEIVWAVGLKYTEGYTRPVASAITIAAMIASVWFLGLAVKTIPIGTGYAIWTGIGAAGTAALGIILFSESTNPLRLASIALIIAGIVGLKLTTGD